MCKVASDTVLLVSMSVENGAVVFKIQTVKGLFIPHKSSIEWSVGMVKSIEKKKSVAVQFSHF